MNVSILVVLFAVTPDADAAENSGFVNCGFERGTEGWGVWYSDEPSAPITFGKGDILLFRPPHRRTAGGAGPAEKVECPLFRARARQRSSGCARKRRAAASGLRKLPVWDKQPADTGRLLFRQGGSRRHRAPTFEWTRAVFSFARSA